MPLVKPFYLVSTNHCNFNRKALFLLFFLAAPLWLIAQSFAPDPDWRFENFNNENHFISTGISDITVDKHGYVWTSSNGIQRFDGYRTIDFNSFDRAKSGLRDNTTDVVADADGRIWVSSAGLCYYDDVSGKFAYIQPDAKHNNITNVFSMFAQKNYLWFVCDYGLAKLDLRSLKISFTSLTGIENPLGTFLIDENTLLISSRQKVYIYNIKNDTYSANTLIYKHSLLKIFTVCKGSSNVFLGTNFGLFTLKNLQDFSLEFVATKDVLIGDLLFLPQDKQKKYLFAGTEGLGIMVYNTESRKIEFTYTHDDNNPGSLANNIISRIFTDKKGRLWISTSLGISMLDVNNQQWKVRLLHKSTKSNLGEISVNKIARDKYDSTKAWMSCYNQGMIRVNWKTKKIEKLFDTSPELQKVYDFAQLSKNKWLIVTQKKIIEWDPPLGMLSQKKLPIPDSLNLESTIRRIIFADVNDCFITSNLGLFKYDLVTHRVEAASVYNPAEKNEDPLKYDLINGFYDQGGLWIASRNGLLFYDIAKRATTFYRGAGGKQDYFFFDIADAAHNQIVCAAGDGIAIFNKRTKSFNVINSIANLSSPNCVSITCINNNMVWIGSEAGVLNYDLDTHLSARAEHETRQIETFATSPFMLIGSDLVFGLSHGFAWFNPGMNTISTPSDPIIERVLVNNQPVLLNFATESNSQKLVFGHADNSINIGFTAFLYADPDHIKFRYRLKGADPHWQYAEDQRNANYAQLEPGDYTFYVQCGNKNGVWNSRVASLRFVIQPPYWETWWFRILALLIVAFALYSIYRYRIKNILAIQKIREGIASDFHDDIGAALSSISIFSEVADTQLEKKFPHEQTREIVGHIAHYSHNMLDAMDDIIWMVNPENDHLKDLAVRMREFAIPLLEAKNIDFDIDIREDILNTRLKMETRKNIFLIFKECINNILKHSGCSAIKVSVVKINSQVQLIIGDNGKGFDIDAPHSRNGLKNMQKRAGEIKGALHVASQPGIGTVITLLVNTV